SWCRSRSRADLSRHRRWAGPLPELQGGRGGVWTDARQVSIRAERPNRRDITVRRRDDADDALRSGSEHAGAFSEMVLAQGLGNEDRQHRGMKKAIVALTRRLAVITHRIWVDGTDSRWTREFAAASIDDFVPSYEASAKRRAIKWSSDNAPGPRASSNRKHLAHTP